MRRVKQLLLGCAICMTALPQPAWALSADRNEPINIEADSATLHEKLGSSTYRGNVHLSQGTLQLHGDTMTVQMRDDQIEKIVLTGSPATFTQRPDNSGENQHAEARRIEYYASDERVILLDKARIWQSGDEEFRSNRIVFNLADNTVSAGGGSDGDRVRITLQPRKAAGTGQAPAAPAPAPEAGPEPAPEAGPGPAPEPAPAEAKPAGTTP